MTAGSGRMERWKVRVRVLKTEVHALSLAYRNPRGTPVPWQAKPVAAPVVAYAVSPIDLIILPLGIMLAVKMIPADVMQACRARAGEVVPEKKKTRAVIGAVIVVIVWMIIIVAMVVFGNKMMTWQHSGIPG